MPSAVTGAGSSLLGVSVQRRCPRTGRWLAGRVVTAAGARDEDGEELYLARFTDGSKERLPASEVKLWSVSGCQLESAGVDEGPVPLPASKNYTEGDRDITPSAPSPSPKNDGSGPMPFLKQKMPVKVSGPMPQMKLGTHSCVSRLQRHRSCGKRRQCCICSWSGMIGWLFRCCAVFCIPVIWIFRLVRLAISYTAAAFALGTSPHWRCQTDRGYAWMHSPGWTNWYWPGWTNWYWPGYTYWPEPWWTYWQQPQPEVTFGFQAGSNCRGWNAPSSAYASAQSTELTCGFLSGLRPVAACNYLRGPCMIIACLYFLSRTDVNMLSISSSNALSLPLQLNWLDTRQLQTDIAFPGDGLMQVGGESLNLLLIGSLKLLLLVTAGVGVSIIFLRLWQLGQFCMLQFWHRLPHTAEPTANGCSTNVTSSHGTEAAAPYNAQPEAFPAVPAQPAVSVPPAVHAPPMASSATNTLSSSEFCNPSSQHYVTLPGECAPGDGTRSPIHSNDTRIVTASMGESHAFLQAAGAHQPATSPEVLASTSMPTADAAGSAPPVRCAPLVFESEQERQQESWSSMAASIVMLSVLTCILLAYLHQAQLNLMSSFSSGGMQLFTSIEDGIAMVGLILLQVPAWIFKVFIQVCFPAAKLLAIGMLLYFGWLLAVPAVSYTLNFVSGMLDQWNIAHTNGEQPAHHETPPADSVLSQPAPPRKSDCAQPVADFFYDAMISETVSSHSASSMSSTFAILITMMGIVVVVTAGVANFVKKLLTNMPTWSGFLDARDSPVDSWAQDHNGFQFEQITGLLDMATYGVLDAFQVLCQLPSLMGGLLWWCLVAPLQSLLTAEVVLVWLPVVCLALIVVAFLDWCCGIWERWSHVPSYRLEHSDTEQHQSARVVQSVPGREACHMNHEGLIAGEPSLPVMSAVFHGAPVASASAAEANFNGDDLSPRFLHSESPVHVPVSQSELQYEQTSHNPKTSQVRFPFAPPLRVGSHYLAVLPGFYRYSVVLLVSEGSAPGTVVVLPCRRTWRRTFRQAPRDATMEVHAIDLHLGPFKMIAGHVPAFVRERLQQLPPGCCRPPQRVVTSGMRELSRRRMSARLEKLASLILPGRRFKYPFELRWVKQMGFCDSHAAAESSSTDAPRADETQRGSLRGLLTRHSGDLWGSVDEILRIQTQQASAEGTAGAKTVAARGGA